MAHSMQDIIGIESQDIMINTIIQCCNINNNSTIKPESTENPENMSENNNFDKVTNNMSDFDEFDQILSRYINEKNIDRNTHSDVSKESNSTETHQINMDIAKNSNEVNNFQGTFEEYLQNNKTESLDVISISYDNLDGFESDRSVDLDAISLASNNIFTNLVIPNEHKSIEIEVDMNNVADSSNIHNITSDARDFQKESTYNSDYNRDIFENESIQNTNDVDNNSECSYHSSDFEIITEEEAKMDGFIIHFRRNDDAEDIFRSNNESYRPNNEDSQQICYKIPEGEEFYNLFRGVYAPAMMPDIFLENKSVIPRQCMSVEKEAIGFDMRVLTKDTSIVDEELQEEAKETAKKILETYGGDRRRSRRLP